MRALTLALCSALATSPAWASTPINQTRPLEATGQVNVENIAGQIVVRTWDKPQVRITGTLGKGVEKLEVSGTPQSLSIEVRHPKGGGWFGGWGGTSVEPSTLEITVPVAASLQLESVSASVDVEGSRGKRLSIDSVSGAVRVAGSAAGAASIETISGDQRVQIATRSLELSSVSGRITAEGAITGDVQLETVSGNASLKTATVQRMELATVSGSLEAVTQLSEDARLSAESVSGDLELNLPAATSAHLQIETFSGGIHAPAGEVRSERHGPGHSLDARMGAGGADVQIETFSGEVRVSTR